MSKLITMGEALIDFMPAETGCGLSEVSGFIKCPGGAPANVAAAAARLGLHSVVLTQLGEDGFGDFLIRTMSEAGVDVSAILRTNKANTGLAFVSLRADGEREFAFYRSPSADVLLEPDDVPDSLFVPGDALHFCSVALTYEQVKNAHRKALTLAGDRGMFVSFDPNLRFPLWPDREALRRTVWEFMPGASIIKVSGDELEFITGATSHDDGVAKLLKTVPAVLMTYGRDGAALYTQNRRVFHPGFNTPAVDTTGAGDAFIGSFLTAYLDLGTKRPPLSELPDEKVYTMLEFSHVAASIVVSKKGAINAMPAKADIEQFIKTIS